MNNHIKTLLVFLLIVSSISAIFLLTYYLGKQFFIAFCLVCILYCIWRLAALITDND